MALFNRVKKTVIEFDKANVIQDIVDAVKDIYPDCHLMEDLEGEDGWNILIIRNVTREVKFTLGVVNVHERQEKQELQQVFAISVAEPEMEFDRALAEATQMWTTMHLVVSEAAQVLRRLKEKE